MRLPERSVGPCRSCASPTPRWSSTGCGWSQGDHAEAGERFVRRLIAERRIRYVELGRRSASPRARSPSTSWRAIRRAGPPHPCPLREGGLIAGRKPQRRREFGTVRKLASGRWQARCFGHRTASGTRHRRRSRPGPTLRAGSTSSARTLSATSGAIRTLARSDSRRTRSVGWRSAAWQAEAGAADRCRGGATTSRVECRGPAGSGGVTRRLTGATPDQAAVAPPCGQPGHPECQPGSRTTVLGACGRRTGGRQPRDARRSSCSRRRAGAARGRTPVAVLDLTKMLVGCRTSGFGSR